MSEVWKDVAQYPGYQVSSLGGIRKSDSVIHYKLKGADATKLLRGRNLKPYMAGRYQSVRKPGTHAPMYVHLLIAEAFIGEKPPGMLTDHIDGDRTNNAASNLRYVTPSINLYNKHNIKGCHMTKRGEYETSVHYRGKDVRLGRFASQDRATEAHKEVRQIIIDLMLEAETARAERDAAKAKLRHVCEIMSTLGNPGLNDVLLEMHAYLFPDGAAVRVRAAGVDIDARSP
jgi:hypothetical protein